MEEWYKKEVDDPIIDGSFGFQALVNFIEWNIFGIS